MDDYTEIAQLQARYGHVMDARDWPALAGLFTADAIFDAAEVGLPRLASLAAIQAGFARTQHPVSHHATNLVVDIDGDTATARSKWIICRRGGKVFSGVYADRLVRTGNGWRIAERVSSPTRPRPDSL